MNVRRAIDLRAGSLMVLLCMTWGFHQIAIKAAAPDVTPLLQIAIRSGIAAVLAGSLAIWRGERSFLANGVWKPGLVVAVLFAVEFLFIGEALRFTTASRTVVFLYTAPIFAALGLHWRLASERLHVAQWIGIAIAFGGIALAFFRSDPASADWEMILLGDALALLSGLAWGATTVVIRGSRLTDAPATITLTYQLAGAFVLLSIAAVCLGQTRFEQTALAWSSILFQGIVVSFASYLAWFWLLRIYLASRLGALSFLTPLFGVAFGVWLLGEPLETNFVVGAAMVLVGIALVNGHEWLSDALAPSGKEEEPPSDS